MKQPEFCTERVKAEKVIPGGQTLGTLKDGKKIFFWNALPSEIVSEFKITKSKSKYVEAIATKIEQPSDKRVAPRDDCYLATSPWQIFDYQYELSEKLALLHEAFRQHQIILNIDIPAVRTDNRDYNYRNKMEYSLYYDNDMRKIYLAFHERGRHSKIKVAKSNLERPEIFNEAQNILQQLNNSGMEARDFQSMLIRCNQEGIVSGGLIRKHQPHPHFDELSDILLDKQYSYSPNGFFQINLPVYEMVLKQIQSQIHTTKVLDLYAGVGTIGLSVAREHNLTLVECDKSAYHELGKNCMEVAQAHPVFAKSEDALNYIEPSQTVIVDPPRAGCKPEVVAKLIEKTPPIVVYLSCNPITQARDVSMLLQKYNIQSVTPYNFFPHTPHLENLVILKARE